MSAYLIGIRPWVLDLEGKNSLFGSIYSEGQISVNLDLEISLSTRKFKRKVPIIGTTSKTGNFVLEFDECLPDYHVLKV